MPAVLAGSPWGQRSRHAGIMERARATTGRESLESRALLELGHQPDSGIELEVKEDDILVST